MKKIILLAAFFSLYMGLLAQNNVGIGTNTPHANAALEIKSNNKGLLMPRLATATRNNMTGVPKGMIVFDSTYNSFYYHDGSKWRPITDNNPDSLLTDYSATPQVTANMATNTTTTARSGLLYDNGGPNGNYNDNRQDIYTIESDYGYDSTIGYKVIIELLSLESPHDSLEIFEVDNYANKQLFTGNRTGTFYFINNGGPLRFTFKSNTINNATGFRIRWSKLFTSKASTDLPPMYGWYFNQRKIAVRGGVNTGADWATDSLGSLSFAYGANNKATGERSVVFGLGNNARGEYSFAAGLRNKADKPYAIAMGTSSAATGWNAVAIGHEALASGDYSFAAGDNSKATARNSVAMGQYTLASDYNAVAMGGSTIASGWYSTAFGGHNIASGAASFAAGSNVKAIGNYSFAAGDRTEASNPGSVAIGSNAHATGNYAVSIGTSTLASGVSATATGQNTSAAGVTSFSSGYYTIASGQSSFASGSFTKAYGPYSIALGTGSEASGAISFAAGENSTASGPNSVALGTYNNSSNSGAISIGAVNRSAGNRSIAIGTTLIVNGDYSTALGTKITIPVASTGSLGIGDLEFSTNERDNTLLANPNEFVARFRGGYFFMTSGNAPGGNYNARTGVKMAAGQNSWSAISDIRLKENFEPVDGENILQKISQIPLTTWNYRAQDPKLFRHYGPMAQDFYNAFGRDKYGSIGCDTLINQQDFLGVSFVAIQALEKRSAAYHSEIEILKQQLILLKQSNELLIKKLERLDVKK